MDVTLHERSSVDFELEIRASHEELEPRLIEALKAQRKKINLKGFRPGKVPLQLVRKMHGQAIAAQVAEEVIGEAWRAEVDRDEEREVIGAPRLTDLEFDYGQDLRAVLRFGVRPQFELADTSEQEVRRLVRPVTDEDVEQEIERRRRRAAAVVVTEGAADEESVVKVDLQAMDKASDTPIVGQRDEDREIDLADERLREELKSSLIGKKTGASFTVDLPHQHGEDEGHDHDDHVDRFLVTVKEVRARALPELDEGFVKEVTAGNVENVEDYRAMVRRELEEASRRLGEDFLREEIVRKLLEAHDFDVPEALVEAVLDDMEEDLAKRVGGELPDYFDRDAYRQSQRESAEHSARWTLIQQRALDEADIELSEADFEAEFERLADAGPGTADMVKQFVAAQPQILQGIRQRLLTDRIFDSLTARFSVVEVSPEDIEAESDQDAV
jgi:trigger factor